MRHPLPFFAAAVTAIFVYSALTVGLAVILNLVWPMFVLPVIGIMLVVFGTLRYRRLASEKKASVWRWTYVLYYVEFGAIFGGIPGALLGRYLAGDVGECLGWLLTALPIAILSGRWGWKAWDVAR